MALMALGMLCFELLPEQMLRVFTSDELVVEIGRVGFRIIGVSFLPLVTSLTFPVFFQATGMSLKSSALTVVRTVVLFVPLGYAFSRFGLDWFWLTFPVTDTVTSIVGFVFYRQFLRRDYVANSKPVRADDGEEAALKPSMPGVIITIAREHGSSGKQIGKLVAKKLGIPFYYKEMVALAAHESGLDKEFISDIHKNAPDALRELYLSSTAVQQAIKAQTRIIRKIADNGACVIVGRAADYVLKDYDNVVRVFIHAPKEFRMRRVMEVYGDTPSEAKRNIRRSDKARASYYRHISGQRWGDARQYQLTLDSSVGIEETANIIVKYVLRAKIKNRPLDGFLSISNQSTALLARMARMVWEMSLSSSQPSIAAPRSMTSLEQPAANFLSLYFFFTDLTSMSLTLFDGRMSATAPMRPVSSSAAYSTFSISLSGSTSTVSL